MVTIKKCQKMCNIIAEPVNGHIGCSSCIIIITVTLCYHASCMGGMHVIWPSIHAAHDVTITCSRIIMCNLIKITSRNVFSSVQRRAVFELDITESSHFIIFT